MKQPVLDSINATGTLSMQLDDSTDVRDNAQPLVYVKYEGPTELKEKLLFCHALPTTTTGNVLQMLAQFFQRQTISAFVLMAHKGYFEWEKVSRVKQGNPKKVNTKFSLPATL